MDAEHKERVRRRAKRIRRQSKGLTRKDYIQRSIVVFAIIVILAVAMWLTEKGYIG